MTIKGLCACVVEVTGAHHACHVQQVSFGNHIIYAMLTLGATVYTYVRMCLYSVGYT